MGLPPGFEQRVRWQTWGRALHVGLTGRPDLVYFKLVAAADGDAPKHLQDLLRLAPADEELEAALAFARTTQVGMDDRLRDVVQHCREVRHA